MAPAIIATCGAAMAFACAASGCDACSSARATSSGNGTGLDTTTRSILTAQSPACLGCAVRNGCLDPAQQGGVCELTMGRVPTVPQGGSNVGSAPLDPP